MIKIAICDDELEICARIESLIIKILDEEGIKYDIDVFNSGEGLCNGMSSCDLLHSYELLFLDIELPKMSGIDIGDYIRNKLKNQFVQIAYISSKQEYAMELFNFRPINFLLNPIDELGVRKVLQQFNAIEQKNDFIFKFKKGRNLYKIPINSIMYFERKSRKIIVHLQDGEYDYYDSLELIYDNLKNHNFLFVHKSYLVNYRYIKIMAYDHVILCDETRIPISQANREKIRKIYMEIEDI